MVRCTFCRIAEGRAKAYKIYEDNSAVCFLDTNPISKGHCLVIPKKHYRDVYEIDNDMAAKIATVAVNIAHLLKKKLHAKGVNILHASGKAAQQSVFHFHLHIVPRYEKDGLDLWPKSKYKERNLDKLLKTIKG